MHLSMIPDDLNCHEYDFWCMSMLPDDMSMIADDESMILDNL